MLVLFNLFNLCACNAFLEAYRFPMIFVWQLYLTKQLFYFIFANLVCKIVSLIGMCLSPQNVSNCYINKSEVPTVLIAYVPTFKLKFFVSLTKSKFDQKVTTHFELAELSSMTILFADFCLVIKDSQFGIYAFEIVNFFYRILRLIYFNWQ